MKPYKPRSKRESNLAARAYDIGYKTAWDSREREVAELKLKLSQEKARDMRREAITKMIDSVGRLANAASQMFDTAGAQ